jgi:aldose 1-epimerase
MSFNAFEGTFHDEKAIWLKAGKYEAALLPNVGGNLIAFRDVENKYNFLHEPTEQEMEAFKARPYVHGIPVLFPPNRYEDGKFNWQGQQYQFPVNEPQTGNHLHGFVHNIPWQVEDFGASKTESFVVVSVTVNKQHPVYTHFPHEFKLQLRYALSENGLSQHALIKNLGETLLPAVLAFHTSINAPFVPGSTEDDYRMKLTIGDRWEMSERMLPTGKYQDLTELEKQFKAEGIKPFTVEMDNHYTAVPQNGSNRMELTDIKQGITLVYDVGTAYKQWMIWNHFNRGEFFCPEPQVNLVNAPNTDLPAEEIGLFSLAQGEIWEETGRIYVINT